MNICKVVWVSHNTQHFIIGLQSEKAGRKQRAGPVVLGPTESGCAVGWTFRARIHQKHFETHGYREKWAC